MAERKEIGKKLRFEVFKRDHFTCQYCGKMAPDVILEVDHLQPVAGGGDNDILNLITACRDCNRGKGKTPLSQNDTLKKSQKQLLDLAEKSEQSQMMIDWKKEMMAIRENEVESISDLIICLTGFKLSISGRKNVRAQLKRFGLPLVWDATEIAIERYFDDRDEYTQKRTFNVVIGKIGGICYNKWKERNENDGDVSNGASDVLDRCENYG